jgi:hypothetical protein
MIDPKLNEIPVERVGDFAEDVETELTDAQKAQRRKTRRAGLSINDTIAGDTTLSVGSRGVDTSGVSAGAGAGAGMTALTPGESVSPAPNIVGGGRGSGTTVRGSVPKIGADAESIRRNPSTEVRSDFEESNISDSEISARAYEYWLERGCPEGSPEVDWQRAKEELRASRRNSLTFAASA